MYIETEGILHWESIRSGKSFISHRSTRPGNANCSGVLKVIDWATCAEAPLLQELTVRFRGEMRDPSAVKATAQIMRTTPPTPYTVKVLHFMGFIHISTQPDKPCVGAPGCASYLPQVKQVSTNVPRLRKLELNRALPPDSTPSLIQFHLPDLDELKSTTTRRLQTTHLASSFPPSAAVQYRLTETMHPHILTTLNSFYTKHPPQFGDQILDTLSFAHRNDFTNIILKFKVGSVPPRRPIIPDSNRRSSAFVGSTVPRVQN